MAKPTVPYIVRICTLFSTPSKNNIGSVRLLFFCFNSVWTTTFATAYILWLVDGAVHLLASIASSIAWLFVNTALWVRVHFLHPALPPILIIVRHLPLTTQAVASGFMQHTRRGGNCAGVPPSHGSLATASLPLRRGQHLHLPLFITTAVDNR